MSDANATSAPDARFHNLLVMSPLAAAPSALDADRCAARPRIAPRGLDAREHGAVMLATTDGKESLRGSGRLHRLAVVCFGVPPRPNKLADPRLEGLRRYAVAVAHDTERAASRERDELVALGFSDHQILVAAATAVRFRAKRGQNPWRHLAFANLIRIVLGKIHQLLEGRFMTLVSASVMTVSIAALAGSGVCVPEVIPLSMGNAFRRRRNYLSIDR